jgi:hypothetical protein
MKNIYDSPRLLKITSIFLIFALLIQLTGCYSFKPISGSDPSISQTDKYRYIIYNKGVEYSLENPVISNGILSGKYKVDLKTAYRTKAIRIFPSPDFVITVDTLSAISIPLDSIAKFKKSKFSVVKTIFVIGIPFWIVSKIKWDWHFETDGHGIHFPIK